MITKEELVEIIRNNDNDNYDGFFLILIKKEEKSISVSRNAYGINVHELLGLLEKTQLEIVHQMNTNKEQ